MCLFIKEDCKIEIADKPIPCKKWVWKGENGADTSYCRNELIEYDKEVKAVDHLEVGYGTIEAGLHAYLDPMPKSRVIISKGFTTSRESDVKYAVIPKGAEYCIGKDGDIVASKMIVFNSKEELDKYLKANENI